MADNDIKHTKGVAKMQEVLANLLHEIDAGDIDAKLFAPFSCETCAHSQRSIYENPCRTCSTATEDSKRDFKPSDKMSWEPGENATTQEIRAYHTYFGLKKLEHYIEFPPERCINPKCTTNYSRVYSRGLCSKCFSNAAMLVKDDEAEALNVTIMYHLADNQEAKSVAMELYTQLNTWENFIAKGYALPIESDYQHDILQEAIIIYYRLARANQQREVEDPTPTEKQMRKHYSSKDMKTIEQVLEIRRKNNARGG